MELSKLVFLSVKNVIYLNDPAFNYVDFIKGDFNNNLDYATNINNVFSPLNEAISRLSDLERIPYIVEEVEVSNDCTVDLRQCEKKIRQVVGLAQVGDDGSYRKLAFRQFGKDKIRIVSNFSTFKNRFYIEYKENIPTFSNLNLMEVTYDENSDLVDNNIDLFEEYGIDEAMSNYIIEYVQGRLLEPLAPELANMHITRAEAYFNNLDIAKKSFPQQSVEKKYRVGG